MQIIDLTMELGPNTPSHPAHPRPLLTQLAKHEIHGYATFIMTMADHTATHVDAPLHGFVGTKSIDQFDLNKFIGKLVVIDISDVQPNSEIPLRLFEQRLPKGVELGPGWIVGFRTGYDVYAFQDYEKWLKHPSLSAELAEHLVKLGINAIGVDAPSPDHAPYPVHRILLPREVLIYENLTNLQPLVGRVAQFYGLPLKIKGGTGSPVRAIAIL